MPVSGQTLSKTPSSRGRLTPDQVADLVAAVRTGEPDAWSRLVDEFSGLLWAITRNYSLSEADAVDIAQNTWLRLLEHLDDITEPSSVGGWLATTARRECLRLLRRSAREVPFRSDAPEPVAPDAAPELALITRERDRALWHAVARLRDSDQALLRLLTTVPQPRYDEIAAALDMPIGSIGPTRARILERLSAELELRGSLELLAA